MPALPFSRPHLVAALDDREDWDLIVIGGGASGLGIAVDAAGRGYRTLLLERSDFAQGTSSRSTKLIHGGVRYLAQGAIRLVFSALRERGLLRRNAPHLVTPLSFVLPCYTRKEQFKFFIGLKLYDWLSGPLSLGASRWLGAAEVARRLPGVRTEGLKGGVAYFDGQFDDSRLAISLARTAVDRGAVVLNHFPVTGLLRDEAGKLRGVTARDGETGRAYTLTAKAVVNATGVFVDAVRRLEVPGCTDLIRPSQGVHLVLDASFLPGSEALLIPETDDGRVLFLIPWQGRLLAGTTDTPVSGIEAEPKALEEEIDFILRTTARYLVRPPQRNDIRSVFAGLRPLAIGRGETTKDLSRDHKISVAPSGLITLIGGKWTTYRKMAAEAVDAAARVGGLSPARSCSALQPLHGATEHPAPGHLRLYGSDAGSIEALKQTHPELGQQLVEGFPYTGAEVVWAVRHEQARTVEDVLARRLRLLLLDARAALAAAPRTARLMALELGGDAAWEAQQLQQFRKLAECYLPQQSE